MLKVMFYPLMNLGCVCCCLLCTVRTHHHQITKLSHSINAIGPAPHRSGRKREHRSIVFATITHIPSLHKIRRNAPRYHPYSSNCMIM
jgi:hypothetical protein